MQRLLDYAHVTIRIPELRKMIDQGRDFPEGAPAELEALTKSIPGLIDKLPYVLPRSDPRHSAALADMIPCLMRLLRPTAFVRLFLVIWLRDSRSLTAAAAARVRSHHLSS